MLITEWNWDDAKAAWYEEGREEERLGLARNALAMGITAEVIHGMTGLSVETVEKLKLM